LITTSAELGVDKPSTDFFRKTLALSAFDPGAVLYVGDRLDNDVIPARSFGMKTALLERGPWGRNHVSWPDAALADFILRDLAGLPALLREIKRKS
jgi:FMN phosphatase YigB (HAD superfamily)